MAVTVAKGCAPTRWRHPRLPERTHRSCGDLLLGNATADLSGPKGSNPRRRWLRTLSLSALPLAIPAQARQRTALQAGAVRLHL